MPIYAYRCERCGHAKDVIQKFSDTPLSICPECGADAFRKQLTAPSFQLKGSGWYVTDFRDNGKKAGAPAPAAAAESPAAAGGTESAKPAEAAKPAESAPAASPPPAKSTPES
ncbi:MAG: zinc ribbon domain-containing protein [Burkholderiales bacterium]|nr:zinc ribbon domain-containing protein [Burkholderiales bacterium]